MIFHIIILVTSATIMVISVRLLLLRGIDLISNTFGLSHKAKGQIIGYATSVPELAVVVSAAIRKPQFL